MPFNGENLKILREKRGLTQKDLFEKTGIKQTVLSKYEQNQKVPLAEALDSLAKALSCPKSFFESNCNGLASGLIFHRKRASLPAKAKTLIEAEAMFRMLTAIKAFKLLGKKSRLPKLEPFDPIFDIVDEVAIATKANDFRSALGIPPGPIGNLIDVLDRHNVMVVEFDFENEQLDGFFVRTPDAICNAINKTFPPDRKRFTLAHELGHVVLHQFPHDKSEDEANMFASAFLMPNKDIKNEFEGIEKFDLRAFAKLKPKWRVSMQALIRRARDTKHIGEETYKRLCIYMSAAHYRKDEPVTIEPEQSTLLDKCLSELIKKSGTPQAVANALDISIADLKETFNL